MRSLTISLMFTLLLTSCLGGGGEESIITPVIQEETLSVDAGTNIYTNSTATASPTISDAPNKTYLWEVISGAGAIGFSSTTIARPVISPSTEGDYQLRLTVTSGSKVVSDILEITYDTTDPVVNAGGDNLLANAAFFQTASVTEINPVTLKWSVTSGPGSLIVSSQSTNPTISVSSDGDYVIRLTATDAAGNSAYDEMNLSWDATKPSVSVGADVVAGALFNKDATTSDAHGMTYLWEKVSGPGNLTFASATSEDTSVVADTDGSYIVRLKATDTYSNVGEDSFTLLFDTTNPVVDAGVDINTNVAVSRTVSVTDTTATTIVWSQVSGPGTMSFNSSTSKTTTISANTEGSYVFRATLTDALGNVGTDDVNFLWDTTVPAITMPADVITGVLANLDATVTDSNTLTYSWSKVSGPGTIVFGSSTSEDTSIFTTTDGDYVLRLTATDGAGNTSSDTVALTWDSTAPTVDAGVDQVVNGLFSQDATVSDTTSVTYLWSKVSGPGNVTFSTGTSEDTDISVDADGQYVIRLTVTDQAGNVASDDMNFVWDTTAPVVDAGIDQNTNILVSQDATVTDLTSLTYSWTKVSGPGNITFSSSTTEDTDISADADGVYVIRLTATDQFGLSSSDDLSFEWDTTNPSVNAGVDQLVNALFNQDATVVDANSTINYQWSKVSGPGSITFGTATAEDTSVTADTDGSYILRLTVTDGAGNSASDDFSLTWDSTAPIVDAGNDQITNVQVNQNATVTDATAITYSWTKISGVGNITFGSASSEDTSIVADADGVYVIRLTATDAAGNSGFDEMSFTYDTTNPTVSVGADIETNIAVNVDATTSDLTNLTYVWTKVSGPGAIIFGSGTSEDTSISANADGDYVIRLTVTDEVGQSSFDELNFTWDTSNPVVDAGVDVVSNVQFNQDATVTDATNLTYSWTKVSGPGTITFGSATSEDTTVQASSDGTYVIQLEATDAVGNVATDTFQLVWDTTAPVVNAGTDKTLNNATTQDATVTDASNNLTYVWSKQSGPGLVIFGSGTSEDTTISPNTDGSYVIRLTVTDEAGNSSFDEMTLVWDTASPVIDAGVDVETDVQVNLDATSSDSTSLTYLWSKVSGGGNLTFGSATSEDTTISADSDGVYVVKLTGTDELGQSSSDTMNFTWDTTNPVVGVGADRIESAQFTLDASSSDLTTMTYLWSAPANISFGSATSEDTTIQASADGSYLITLTVTDAVGNSSNDSFTLTWDSTAPVVNAGSDATSNVQISQNATITETNISTIQWSKVSGPGSVSFGSATSEDTTILPSTDGTYVIRLTVVDTAGNTSFDEMTLIYDTTAPTVNVGSDIVANSLQNIDATTSDQTAMTYSWTAPVNVSFGSANAEDTNITASADGTYLVTLTVTDAAGNSASDSLSFTWDQTNPVVNVGADLELNAQSTIDATVTEANVQSYSWTKVSGPGNIVFGSSTSEDTTIAADSDGTYVIRLTVSDTAGNSSFDELSLLWDTNAPSIVVGNSFNGTGAVAVVIDATVTDTSTLTYSWSQSSGPGTINFSTTNTEDTSVTADTDGTYTIFYQVTDQLGNSSSRSITLTWTGAPFAPARAREEQLALSMSDQLSIGEVEISAYASKGSYVVRSVSGYYPLGEMCEKAPLIYTFEQRQNDSESVDFIDRTPLPLGHYSYGLCSFDGQLLSIQEGNSVFYHQVVEGDCLDRDSIVIAKSFHRSEIRSFEMLGNLYSESRELIAYDREGLVDYMNDRSLDSICLTTLNRQSLEVLDDRILLNDPSKYLAYILSFEVVTTDDQSYFIDSLESFKGGEFILPDGQKIKDISILHRF